MTAQSAIKESTLHNRIVTIDYDRTELAELKSECTDWVKNNGITELWGRDDENNHWRVHVRGAEWYRDNEPPTE